MRSSGTGPNPEWRDSIRLSRQTLNMASTISNAQATRKYRLPTRHTLQYYTPNTLETAPLPHFSATLPTHRRCLLGLLGFHRAGTSVRGVGRANPDGYSKSCEIPHASDGNKSTNRVGYGAARISHVSSIQAL
jgi:hypothetical protein